MKIKINKKVHSIANIQRQYFYENGLVNSQFKPDKQFIWTNYMYWYMYWCRDPTLTHLSFFWDGTNVNVVDSVDRFIPEIWSVQTDLHCVRSREHKRYFIMLQTILYHKQTYKWQYQYFDFTLQYCDFTWEKSNNLLDWSTMLLADESSFTPKDNLKWSQSNEWERFIIWGEDEVI